MSIQISSFTFNPFAENTYIISDSTQQCAIIDPGCSTPDEQDQLTSYISEKGLTPIHLINTHCHIDHVLGNKFVAEKYNLPLTSHQGEQVVLDMQPSVSQMYGIPYDPSPAISIFIDEGDSIDLGSAQLKVLYTPGHSPASVSLYCEETLQLIAGDVLFDGSIGRTDLPGGDFNTLIQSIRDKLLVLNDKVVVFPGHGAYTTIGKERRSNPFLT